MSEEVPAEQPPVSTPLQAQVLQDDKLGLVAVRFSAATELFIMDPESAMHHATQIAQAAQRQMQLRAVRKEVIQLRPTILRPGHAPQPLIVGPNGFDHG